MKTYGGGYPEDSLFYHKLLVKMKNTIDEKNSALEGAKARIPEVQDDYDRKLKEKDAQLARYKEDATRPTTTWPASKPISRTNADA